MGTKRLKRINFEWNPNLAYAIGLIATDGYVSKDKRHIVLTSSDYDQLITFRECLNKTNKPSINPPSSISKKTSYRIQIGDVVFLEWLNKIGLKNRKSLTIGSIKIPDKYIRDFLRGHLDGDGHVQSYVDKYNTYKNPKYIYNRLFIFFLSGSKRHIIWIRKKILKLIKINGSFQEIKSKTQLGNNNMYSIKYSTKEATKLANWMYYNPHVPCLKRKRAKLLNFLK